MALVNTLTDLDTQNKNLELRNLFRLSYHETITMEESPCYYFHKPSSSMHTGNLYLTQNFANFASQPSPPPAAPTTTSTANPAASISISMLFDTSQDPNLIFVIPYPHIVSIKKQPATALQLPGKLISIMLSGYLVVSTKNRGEFWLAFASSKNRDRVSEILLSRIRTVDWRFDDDVVIGGRNSNAILSAGVTSTPGVPETTNTNSNRLQLLKTGLKFILPHVERNGRPVIKEDDPAAVARWTDYFDAYGRD
eukprot:jgi/Hompol1/4182/HPOL_006971-RA